MWHQSYKTVNGNCHLSCSQEKSYAVRGKLGLDCIVNSACKSRTNMRTLHVSPGLTYGVCKWDPGLWKVHSSHVSPGLCLRTLQVSPGLHAEFACKSWTVFAISTSKSRTYMRSSQIQSNPNFPRTVFINPGIYKNVTKVQMIPKQYLYLT